MLGRYIYYNYTTHGAEHGGGWDSGCPLTGPFPEADPYLSRGSTSGLTASRHSAAARNKTPTPGAPTAPTRRRGDTVGTPGGRVATRELAPSVRVGGCSGLIQDYSEKRGISQAVDLPQDSLSTIVTETGEIVFDLLAGR